MESGRVGSPQTLMVKSVQPLGAQAARLPQAGVWQCQTPTLSPIPPLPTESSHGGVRAEIPHRQTSVGKHHLLPGPLRPLRLCARHCPDFPNRVRAVVARVIARPAAFPILNSPLTTATRTILHSAFPILHYSPSPRHAYCHNRHIVVWLLVVDEGFHGGA
jgi:hypothetical protein